MDDFDMDVMASTFEDFAGFMPIMMIDRSETCATRKLLQCTGLGVYFNDVSDKFAGNSARDLYPAEFKARKAIVRQVERWCDSNKKARKHVIPNNEWTPILHKFEIVKTSAKTERDWGHLLFTDLTVSRFLLVMTFLKACNCGNLSHHDYGALTRYHADRLMSLLVYLHGEWKWGNKPDWIRATYVTPHERKYKMSSEFLDTPAIPPGENLKDGRPPIYVVTPRNFKRSLLPKELEKIDNTVAHSPDGDTRKGKSVRDKVCGSKKDKPDVSSALKGKSMRHCGWCGEPKELRQLHICTRCKLKWYCSKECQREAWPHHKVSCRKAPSENITDGTSGGFNLLGVNGKTGLIIALVLLYVSYVVWRRCLDSAYIPPYHDVSLLDPLRFSTQPTSHPPSTLSCPAFVTIATYSTQPTNPLRA
ncbi:hypothetical protein PENSPDRAFT_655633 [Peniophora sp. CONT]|nr:hypothetical protein PENSPDRAFT_655633 [Peniophora sp. CONT]